MEPRGFSTAPQFASGTWKQGLDIQYNTQSNFVPSAPSYNASDDGSDMDWTPERILFYDRDAPYYEFTNFSQHDVIYKGKRYPTSEHLFQAFKFLDGYSEIAEQIRKCGERSMLAFDEAHRYQKFVRPDWRQVHVEKMEIALYHKFTRHADLKALLLGTGDADLVEDSPRDYFWGIGADHSGRNELGKALMRLRTELREERNNPYMIPIARKDITRHSAHDLPSMVLTRPVSNMNGSHSKGYDSPNKIPDARGDNTRYSVQDYSSLESAQPVPNLRLASLAPLRPTSNANVLRSEDRDNLYVRKDNLRHSFHDLPSLMPTQLVSNVNVLLSEPRINMCKISVPRRDTTHNSVRDATSLLPTQSASNANRPRSPAAAVSGSGPASTQMAPPQSSGLCELCRVRPRFQNHPYCGRTCAAKANMCRSCCSKPRFGTSLYCSRTCAINAGAMV